MSIEKNVQTVGDFFAAIGRGDREGLLPLIAEDIEWIIPGEDWPLAGTYEFCHATSASRSYHRKDSRSRSSAGLRLVDREFLSPLLIR